jgi:hypothetical protein
VGRWHSWVSFWSARESGESLAAFRILMGLCLLATVGGVLVHDLVAFAWLPSDAGGFRVLRKGPHLVEWLGGLNPRVVWTLVTTALASGALLVLGIGGRLTALVAAQSYLALSSINGMAGGSYQPFLVNGLWLLVLSDSTATWSLSCKLRTGGWTSDRQVAAWPRYLVLVQLAIVYASTGLQKIASVWTPIGGLSAIFYVLQDHTWVTFYVPPRLLGWLYPLTQAMTAATWLFEVSWLLMPLYVYYRHTADRGGRLRGLAARTDLRPWFTAFGLSLHVGIALMLEVATFSWITLSFYVAMWRPAEVGRGANRLAVALQGMARKHRTAQVQGGA